MKTLTAVALLALSACVKTVAGNEIEHAPGPGSGPRAADFYPLAVGNVWSYKSSMAPEIMKIEITRQEGSFFFDSSGAKLTVDAFGLRDDKRYLLREPVEVGNEWNNVVSASSTERYKIVAAGIGCSAPSGSYQGCVVVESRNRIDESKTMQLEMTFAPQVGLVRIQTVLDHKGRQIPQTNTELVKFEPKAQAAAK